VFFDEASAFEEAVPVKVGVAFGGEAVVPSPPSAFLRLLRVTILFGETSPGAGLSELLMLSDFGVGLFDV